MRWILIPGLWLVPVTVMRAYAGEPADAFVAAAFPATPAPRVLLIRGAIADDVAGILGYAYPHDGAQYWSEGGRTAWILEGQGKSESFTAGFVVEQGRIASCQVLRYTASRGREIRSRRFLRQFAGAALRADRQLDRTTDAITGATISSHAVRNLARLALYLDGCAREATKSESGGA